MHFRKDIQHQLYSDADDRSIFTALRGHYRDIMERLEQGRVAAQQLGRIFMNAACDDLAPRIAGELVLPLLQKRWDEAARQFAEEKARQAQEEIIALMEVRWNISSLRM